MDYFGDGVILGLFDHIPNCSAWIDCNFPHYYTLNYAHRGRIRWALNDGRSVVLNAPVAWWTVKGSRPRYRYGRIGSETWDHYYVTVDGPRAARLFRQGFAFMKSHRPYAFIADSNAFRLRWERLLLALKEGGPGRDLWGTYELEGIVLQIRQPLLSRVKSPLDTKLDVLRKAVETRPSKVWDWDQEASSLGVSLVHLRRSFRKLTGLPLHQYLLKVRMEEAASRLRTTKKSIKEIAESVGIPDIYHFGKQFKAYFHLPPATYRNEISNPYS